MTSSVLADVAGAAISDELPVFCPRRRIDYSRHQVSNFTSTLKNKPVEVLASRLRATWIVQHLTAGTPLKLLLEMAGIVSPEVFEPYMRFVPRAEAHIARYLMRNADPSRFTADNGDGGALS